MEVSSAKVTLVYFRFANTNDELEPIHRPSLPPIHLEKIRLNVSVKMRDYYEVVISLWLKIKVVQCLKVLKNQPRLVLVC